MSLVGPRKAMYDGYTFRGLPLLVAYPTATATATSNAATLLSNAWTVAKSQAGDASIVGGPSIFRGAAGLRTSFTIGSKGYYMMRWQPIVNINGAGLYQASLLLNGTIIKTDSRYAGGSVNNLALLVDGSDTYNQGDIITFQLSCTTTSAFNATTITMQAAATGTFSVFQLFMTM